MFESKKYKMFIINFFRGQPFFVVGQIFGCSCTMKFSIRWECPSPLNVFTIHYLKLKLTKIYGCEYCNFETTEKCDLLIHRKNDHEDQFENGSESENEESDDDYSSRPTYQCTLCTRVSHFAHFSTNLFAPKIRQSL